MENMKARADEKNFPFVYLKDETQEVYKTYGATKTPHIYLLQNTDGKFKVRYVGASNFLAWRLEELFHRSL